MRRHKCIYLAILLLSIFSSCSVKEERTPCPCWLSLDLSGCKEQSDSLTISLCGNSPLYNNEIAIEDHLDIFEQKVTRTMVTASALCGYNKSLVQDNAILSPLGEQAPAVLGYVRTIDCRGESARDSVILGRQTARVHLEVETKPGEAYPFDLAVSCNVCGFSRRDLSPIKGEFSYALNLDKESSCSFRLYRQPDYSYPVIVVSKKGQTVEKLPLYEWIEATGYDWKANDLKDIYIGMDYARAHITIKVQDWQSGDSIHITI